MATNDPQRPMVLITTASDAEATAIVTALTAHGIPARATGGYTAGFRAEAPGRVQVIVREGDLSDAQAILAAIQDSSEPDEDDADSGE